MDFRAIVNAEDFRFYIKEVKRLSGYMPKVEIVRRESDYFLGVYLPYMDQKAAFDEEIDFGFSSNRQKEFNQLIEVAKEELGIGSLKIDSLSNRDREILGL